MIQLSHCNDSTLVAPRPVNNLAPIPVPKSKAAQDFKDQMRKFKAVPQQASVKNPTPAVRQNQNKENHKKVDEEMEYQLLIAAEKEQEKRFQKEVEEMKIKNDKKENLMKIEKAEMDEKADMKFKLEFEKQEREHEINFKKAKEDIENYERETQRLLQERIKVWKACNDAFLACIYIQQLWEEKEKQWADWLESLKTSISEAKTRFKLFERVLQNINRNGPKYEKIVNSELKSLHKSTLSAYYLVFDACKTVKKLVNRFDGVFLKILLKNLVTISNNLCTALENIDQCMSQIDLTDPIHHSFLGLSSFEVPSVFILREDSKTYQPDGLPIEEPRVYSSSTTLNITEIH
ncbi:hypothetical protein GCK72_008103 [Caenorhabditis remanei]|uniref:Uncharacterized protein n=1 Tax=Caenorhabditis remanei TaxID=31234 RepID=A0A6A5HLX1_CAERE|nr:hypothetical protein GCK72_008103 [Caenorhabditis remanei]KAF1768141.1 hypothetical protein GCK72_008103 [Caenorhabditis remanei]